MQRLGGRVVAINTGVGGIQRFILRAEWDKVPNLDGMIFNATPIDVEVKGTLIDGRPFVEGQGRVIADLQAEEQYKIYTKWMM